MQAVPFCSENLDRMARSYRLTLLRRFGNVSMHLFIRLSVVPRSLHLLRVRGRKSGRAYTTPVQLVEENSRRYLVAPYGVVNWVKNARAAGEVTLIRGLRSQVMRVQEVSPQESAPVLRTYLRRVPIVRPYFDVRPDSPPEAFAAEAPKHPVFRIESRLR